MPPNVPDIVICCPTSNVAAEQLNVPPVPVIITLDNARDGGLRQKVLI